MMSRFPSFSLAAIALATLTLFAPAALAEDPQPGPLSAEAAQIARWIDQASAEFDVPVEVLQAVAFVESRWRHLVPEPHFDEIEMYAGRTIRVPDQNAQPPAYGVMGLRDDHHFGYSLREAAALIGRTPDELKASPELNIRGAAALLRSLSGGATRSTALEHWEAAIALYSGIPEPQIADMYTYDVLNTIISGRTSDRFAVRQQELDLEFVYGREKLQTLSAPFVTLREEEGDRFRLEPNSSPDYSGALWNAAASCNYTAGRSTSITHVAEHIAQGSYSGTISWFKNCDANVSAHYVVRSSDGQVTQMVHEKDTAWHVANHNSYTVGVEHEGYASDCAWYTTAMYNGSSKLTQNIADRRGIPRDGTYDASLGWDTELDRYSKWKIKGHTNFPTTKSCPGACFDWPRFRSLVIGSTWSQIVDNASTRFTASSNWATSSYSSQRYSTDYRYTSPAAVSDSAWYKFNVPATASYEVYIWYPANSGYNDQTPVVIVTSSGNVTKKVNQRVNGGTWVSLGVYTLSAGDANKVGISRWTSGSGYVIADAVKLVRR